MKNVDLRREIREASLKLWQIADELGMTDVTFSKKLRKEFTEKQKIDIRRIITKLKNEII